MSSVEWGLALSSSLSLPRYSMPLTVAFQGFALDHPLRVEAIALGCDPRSLDRLECCVQGRCVVGDGSGGGTCNQGRGSQDARQRETSDRVRRVHHLAFFWWARFRARERNLLDRLTDITRKNRPMPETNWSISNRGHQGLFPFRQGFHYDSGMNGEDGARRNCGL